MDLVSLETKLALVLEGEGDIQDVLKGLEEIERLDKTGVLGAGTLDCEFWIRMEWVCCRWVGGQADGQCFVIGSTSQPIVSLCLDWTHCSPVIVRL